jgi:hypothetical protein
MKLPVLLSISTPYLFGSAPRLYFGVCHVRETCVALYLLCNPTDVPAQWSVDHVPDGGKWKQGSAIRVKGFESISEVDDPSVFVITPSNGRVQGPTVSVAAAMAAAPKDYNRIADMSIIDERLVESSWAKNTLTLQDSLVLKNNQHTATTSTAFEAQYPMPINITFQPKKNVRYCSRYRFTCEFANSFDLVVQGEGTFEENEHRPLNPIPR